VNRGGRKQKEKRWNFNTKEKEEEEVKRYTDNVNKTHTQISDDFGIPFVLWVRSTFWVRSLFLLPLIENGLVLFKSGFLFQQSGSNVVRVVLVDYIP
jgi:hypothetical protein